MDTQKLIARLRERAATHDAAGSWSLDKAAADELERLTTPQAGLPATNLFTLDVMSDDPLFARASRVALDEFAAVVIIDRPELAEELQARVRLAQRFDT